MNCYKPGDFQKYFGENMDALNLAYPKSLFDSYNATVANLTIMLEALKTLGKGATVAELIGATTGLEKLRVAATLGAAAYVGAVLGSLAVATGRSISCGSRISDVFIAASVNHLNMPKLHTFYSVNREVLDPSHPYRKGYALRAKSSPASFEYA